MLESEYGKSCTEVLQILAKIPRTDYNKIPKDIIQVLKDKQNKDYYFKYDVNRELDDQNVSKYTKLMIAIFYRDYWSTQEEREEIKKYEKEYRLQKEILKSKNYINTDIFNNKNNNVIKKENKETEKSIIKVDKKWYRKMFSRLKNLFK